MGILQSKDRRQEQRRIRCQKVLAGAAFSESRKADRFRSSRMDAISPILVSLAGLAVAGIGLFGVVFAEPVDEIGKFPVAPHPGRKAREGAAAQVVQEFSVVSDWIERPSNDRRIKYMITAGLEPVTGNLNLATDYSSFFLQEKPKHIRINRVEWEWKDRAYKAIMALSAPVTTIHVSKKDHSIVYPSDVRSMWGLSGIFLFYLPVQPTLRYVPLPGHHRGHGN